MHDEQEPAGRGLRCAPGLVGLAHRGLQREPPRPARIETTAAETRERDDPERQPRLPASGAGSRRLKNPYFLCRTSDRARRGLPMAPQRTSPLARGRRRGIEVPATNAAARRQEIDACGRHCVESARGGFRRPTQGEPGNGDQATASAFAVAIRRKTQVWGPARGNQAPRAGSLLRGIEHKQVALESTTTDDVGGALAKPAAAAGISVFRLL